MTSDYETLRYSMLGAGVFLLLLTLILAVRWDLVFLFNEVSGRRARREISRIESRNNSRQTGHLTSESEMYQDFTSGSLDSSMSFSAPSRPSARKKPVVQKAPAAAAVALQDAPAPQHEPFAQGRPTTSKTAAAAAAPYEAALESRRGLRAARQARRMDETSDLGTPNKGGAATRSQIDEAGDTNLLEEEVFETSVLSQSAVLQELPRGSKPTILSEHSSLEPAHD